MRIKIWISACWLISRCILVAQTDTTVLYDLQAVEVKAPRMEGNDLNLPLAISVVTSRQLQQGQPQLALSEGLGAIPGVITFNPDNFAQDLRIAIRGFGARAAFGIRGIRLFVDGLPESTPDGQAQVDNLDMGMLERAEVIRGPTAGLYGNAAGGVLHLYTEEPSDSFCLSARLAAGAYGYHKYQLGIGQRLGALSYQVYGAHWHLDGYRRHSRAEQSLINTKIHWDLNKNNRLSLLLNHANSPFADDAGAITATQAKEDRRQAYNRNVQFNAGEALNQQRIGLIWKSNWGGRHTFTTRAYTVKRQFENSLAFMAGGIVAFDRIVWGLGADYALKATLAGKPYRLQIGLDGDAQRDDRQRYDNLDGKRGALVLDQLESFSGIGAFLSQQWMPIPSITLSLSLRYDRIYLSAEDRYLVDGDDSGNRDYNSFNPMLGFSYQLKSNWHLYANVARSFETPALTELSANPEGGGFNGVLEPQRSVNYELGAKGLSGNRLKWDAALFWIDSRNELAAYELEGFPGRTFYRNSGQSQRIGLELAANIRLARGLTTNLAYTYSHFTYVKYQTPEGTFNGNDLPGLPRHTAFAEIRYLHPTGLWAAVQCRYLGGLYADDANANKDKAYALVNVRLGYERRFRHWSVAPFLGANNLFDTAYNGNVRINAFGGRYFEPAPGLYVFGGVALEVF